MRIDDHTSAPATSVPLALHGPAQRSIAEFAALHRGLPSRGRWARMFGRSPLHESSASSFWTAAGQLDVAAALNRLGPEWRVFRGVPGPAPAPAHGGGSSWVDHLVVGPTGVFTVTAYDHTRQNVWVGRRSFLVDGHRLQYIRVAEAEVGHVERMLGDAIGGTVTASAIIAVIAPGSLQVRDLPRDVSVVSSGQLVALLQGGERRIDAERVRLVAAAVGRDGTWPGEREPPTDEELAAAVRERLQFARVRREVVTATFVRAAWVIGVAGLFAAMLVTAGILQLVNVRAG